MQQHRKDGTIERNSEIAVFVELVVDGILEEYPDDDLATLISRLESDAVARDDGDDPDVATAIIAELHKRVAAGVRTWTGQRG